MWSFGFQEAISEITLYRVKRYSKIFFSIGVILTFFASNGKCNMDALRGRGGQIEGLSSKADFQIKEYFLNECIKTYIENVPGL